MIDLKKRIISLAERQRFIETITLISGVCGAFFGVIIYRNILGGIIWAIGNSFFGGIIGLFIIYSIGGKQTSSYRRHKFEREVSIFFSALGSILIGAALGGIMGIMMNLRHFSLIYGAQIDAAVINIIDGTLMGGIGGAIGAFIGTYISEFNFLFLEWMKRRQHKKIIQSLKGETNAG